MAYPTVRPCRLVSLDIGEVVWSRPGAPTSPSTLSLVVDGWSYKGVHPQHIGAEQAEGAGGDRPGQDAQAASGSRAAPGPTLRR